MLILQLVSFNFIMASQTNTFRLQRLTKTMGTREHSQTLYQPKQTFKLAALNSITRGVKYNDLSYMSGRDLNKLRKEPEAGEDIQYESAHSNLAGVRKNYDSVHKDKNKRENSITKLKEQKRKLSITETQLKNNRENGDKQVKQLTDTLEYTKLLFTEAEIQKKVLLNMKSRLKADKIVYDQRKFDLEKELKFYKKQKQVIIIDKTDLTENDDRTNKVYKKFLAQLQKEQEEREEHLRNIEAMIQEKQRVNQLNEFRSREMQDIAERAMQDKDDNEKNWEKLYLTNKLLSKLLRDKMDREMQKFFVVESAFKIIKIATGVSDAETLIQKFLNKESAYGDLLGKIAENEKRIQALKQEGEELRKQFKQLESEKEVIDNTKRGSVDVESDLKRLEEVDKREEKSELYREKIRNWIIKTNKKMNSILGKQYPLNIERSFKAVSTAFIEYLNNLNAEFESIKDKDIFQDKNYLDEPLKEKKLIRIKDNIAKQKQQQQDDDAHGDHNQQNDLIAGQRIQILKSNEKFMKEVKKKYEQKKKLAAEAASPKKRNEAQKAPVKKPEDD